MSELVDQKQIHLFSPLAALVGGMVLAEVDSAMASLQTSQALSTGDE